MFPDSPFAVPPALADGVLDESFGLRCWQGTPAPMAAAHRHDDIEVNVVASGEVVYLFGGRQVRIGAGRTAAFWATMPHQLIDAADGTRSHWLTVPLPTFLSWPMPQRTRDRLLAVEPVVGPAGTAAGVDAAMFAQWAGDLDAGGERREIATLEIQARLRRLAAGGTGTVRTRTGALDAATAHGVTMAAFIARHYAEPIGPADVAGAVHLHPHHAMAVFKQVVGTTIGGYLARCRVAQAQRLLLVTPLPVTEIGHRAGFTSTSRFYSVFTDVVGVPPGRYRRAAGAQSAAVR